MILQSLMFSRLEDIDDGDDDATGIATLYGL